MAVPDAANPMAMPVTAPVAVPRMIGKPDRITHDMGCDMSPVVAMMMTAMSVCGRGKT